MVEKALFSREALRVCRDVFEIPSFEDEIRQRLGAIGYEF
jgi:hypothetical protein